MADINSRTTRSIRLLKLPQLLAKMDKTDTNLKLVTDGFFTTVLNNRQYDQAHEFIHHDFIKHYHDGRPDAHTTTVLKEYQDLVTQFPNLKSVIKKSIAHGDEVWLWTNIEGLPEGVGLDIVEICRVQDGKVREKWDVHQQKTA
jgi:predicted SnoaL-like aldol condensation-catalyzing enzyme